MGMNCNKKSGLHRLGCSPRKIRRAYFSTCFHFYTMGYHLSMADEITSKVDWISELLLYEYTEMVIFYWTLC